MKDVGGVAEKRSLGPTARKTDVITHTRTEEGHFYSPHPPTSGENEMSGQNCNGYNSSTEIFAFSFLFIKGCSLQIAYSFLLGSYI